MDMFMEPVTGPTITRKRRRDETDAQRVKREKAAERQRRKREKDRAAQMQKQAQEREQAEAIAHMIFNTPPEHIASLASPGNVPPPLQPFTTPPLRPLPDNSTMTPEECDRREKIRLAARDRQRKHRQALKEKKMKELGLETDGSHAVSPAPSAIPAAPAPATAAFGGQTFASTLLLSFACAPLLKAHLLKSLRMTNSELASLEPIIADAWDKWNAERLVHFAKYGSPPHLAPDFVDPAPPGPSESLELVPAPSPSWICPPFLQPLSASNSSRTNHSKPKSPISNEPGVPPSSPKPSTDPHPPPQLPSAAPPHDSPPTAPSSPQLPAASLTEEGAVRQLALTAQNSATNCLFDFQFGRFPSFGLMSLLQRRTSSGTSLFGTPTASITEDAFRNPYGESPAIVRPPTAPTPGSGDNVVHGVSLDAVMETYASASAQARARPESEGGEGSPDIGAAGPGQSAVEDTVVAEAVASAEETFEMSIDPSLC